MDDGVRVDVRVVETQRVFPTPTIAVSDESGTSVGVAVKVLSRRGRPHDMTVLSRFGGEQVLEFTEASALLTGQRPWHTGRVTLRDRLNRIDDFNETMGTELPQDDARTLAGLVFNALGRGPAEGDEVTFGDVRLTVEQTDGPRITRLLIRA